MQRLCLSYTVESGWSNPFPSWDSASTLVLVFGAPRFAQDHAPLRAILDAFPQSHVLGCSTAGEILDTSIHDESLSVAIIKFESTQLRSIATHVAAAESSYSAGLKLAVELDQADLRAVFVLSDGLNVNGTDLVSGFNEIFDGRVVVTGGLAGDGCRFQETYVIHNGLPTSGMVCAIGFYGDKLHVGHGSRGGWDKFGHEREVTRAEGNVLFELDGKPALEVYKQYLGDRARELPASALLFPLTIWMEGPHPEPVVRSILAVNEDEGSMIFAGDIPEGSSAQLLYANLDRVISGAAQAAEDAHLNVGGNVLAIGVSCVGRRLVLNDRTDEELEAVLDTLAPGTQMVGFYSYGELSPTEQARCDLHNQSMTLTTLYEEAA